MKFALPVLLLLSVACSQPQSSTSGDAVLEVSMDQVRVKYQPPLPPAYPKDALEARVEGLVYVLVTVGKDGLVSSARATSGPELLYKPTEEFWSKCQYEPLIKGGQPRSFRFKAFTPFRLKKK
jgi:protein TonB